LAEEHRTTVAGVDSLREEHSCHPLARRGLWAAVVQEQQHQQEHRDLHRPSEGRTGLKAGLGRELEEHKMLESQIWRLRKRLSQVDMWLAGEEACLQPWWQPRQAGPWW
jgi:hypothetical protein